MAYPGAGDYKLPSAISRTKLANTLKKCTNLSDADCKVAANACVTKSGHMKKRFAKEVMKNPEIHYGTDVVKLPSAGAYGTFVLPRGPDQRKLKGRTRPEDQDQDPDYMEIDEDVLVLPQPQVYSLGKTKKRVVKKYAPRKPKTYPSQPETYELPSGPKYYSEYHLNKQ